MRSDAQKRRGDIITAAAAMFKEHGYAVALEAIAARAGVGRATLYRSFADRHALATAVLERHVENVASVAASAGEARDAFLQILRAMCESRTDHGALANAIMVQDGGTGRVAIDRLRSRIEGICAAPVERAKRLGLIRPDFRLEDVHRITQMLAAGASEDALDDPETQYDRTLELIMTGLCPPKLP